MQKIIGVSLGVLLIIAGLFYVKKPQFFLAARMDGAPITKWELDERLRQRFGEQILDVLIGEKLISQEALKKNIVIAEQDVDQKLKEIENNLQGVKLEDSLKMQGISIDEFRSQARLQLTIDKLLDKESSVSSAEIDGFIASQSSFLIATESAAQKLEAEKLLKSQKISEKFAEWFQNLKKQSKIERYL